MAAATRQKFTLKALLIGSFALLCGCGYSLQGGGSILPPDVQRIYIPLAENNTAESGLAQVVTEALRDHFDRFGVLTVVEKLGEADAVLKSRIIALRRDTHSATSGTDVVLQREVSLTLAGELRRTNGQLLWQGDQIRVARPYGATGDVIVTTSPGFSAASIDSADLSQLGDLEVSRGAEQLALEVLSQEAAQIIYNDAVLPDF